MSRLVEQNAAMLHDSGAKSSLGTAGDLVIAAEHIALRPALKTEERFGLLINRCVTETIADCTLKGRMITELEQ